ncbi:SWIM zinc finger family protein [Nonomuraea sp. SYSU D8015]|uniref:SWIM zinc finger family protein n=1 Tax=Nonomuraea sp. SYSU D8015 TaxID=2593644 RepID=UPI00166064B6|nr:SWIM zinc finger family protein [Nonomuraea sp. SYSU D8015]
MNAARGFRAFPPQRAGARFATSWWGRAWVKAVEDTSLDQVLLRKGRAYAKTGRLGPITVSPGRIAAVAESEYDTVVRVEQLSDAEWERFLDQVAAKSGHIAALLDRDMPHDLVKAAEDAAVPLLPAVGDLDPDCSCPDWGLPCAHAAALCYQVSWLLDADPFVLLLMRGRGERRLIEALQRREPPMGLSAGAGGPGAARVAAEVAAARGALTDSGMAADDEVSPARGAAARGVPAAEAFEAGEPVLPDPPPYDVPFAPPALDPPPGADGPSAAALRVLAASAASRARELLDRGRLPELTEYQDRVRLAAEHDLDLGLDTAVAAWRYGGADGLEVLESAWTPPRQDLARAHARLAAGWEGERPPEIQTWRNRWTIGSLQLRYGRDGRWYPFVEREGRWWPAGPPERDASTLAAASERDASTLDGRS